MSDKKNASEVYIKSLENANKITENAIRSAIGALGLFNGCNVLDVPCGIGNHALWMAQDTPNSNIIGVDFLEEHIDYARRLKIQMVNPVSVVFEKGDINNLNFKDDLLDFIWCCDGLWPGPVESGCVAETPFDILESLKRIVKPGGTIALLFWSSQKLLPGYPLIEAALNACPSSLLPMTENQPPELHFMRAPSWLAKAGFVNIRSRTFCADICGPLDNEYKEALHKIFDMLWRAAEREAAPRVRAVYKLLIDPQSDEYILANPDYAGFITYTMFTGKRPL